MTLAVAQYPLAMDLELPSPAPRPAQVARRTFATTGMFLAILLAGARRGAPWGAVDDVLGLLSAGLVALPLGRSRVGALGALLLLAPLGS